MCLLVCKGDFITIADKDIVVYKWVKRRWNYWIPPIYYKNKSKFSYNKPITALDENKNPIKHLVRINGFYYDRISEGFHSNLIRGNNHTNVICIIPKGAEYCFGRDNDIVSTKLIVFRHIWNYWWYKLQHK